MIVESFKNWCEEHKLFVESFGLHSISILNDKKFLLIDSDIEELFDENFNINYSREENKLLDSNDIDYVIFRFGNLYYYSDPEYITLNLFLYIGLSNISYGISELPYLGIHGEYELGNGTRLYKDWVKKSQWLNINSLGICELDTLGGVVSFQQECVKKEIRPILGETLTFYLETEIKIIVFCKSELSFESLIKLNNTKKRSFNELHLLENKDLLIILSNETHPKYLELLRNYLPTNKIFYQLDLAEWDSDLKDQEILLNFQYYLDYCRNGFKTIMLQTSYFLEKSESKMQRLLNKITNYGFNSTSKNHYFRDLDDIYFSIKNVVDSKDVDILFWESIETTISETKDINFKIKLKNLYLPKYELDREQRLLFKSEDELILDLICKGMENNNLHLKEEYWERVQSEFEVIKEGGFVSYFLILYDIINFCKENDIWWGVGRGCFLPTINKVLMSNNTEKNIEDVKLGDSIKNHFNKDSFVKNIYVYNVEEEIVELEFEDNVKIFCTKDHKFYTSNRGWVEADKLNNYDEVVSY